MKKLERILIVLLLITSSVTIIPSVYAKPMVYYANGSLVEYVPESPYAQVVKGHWSLKIKKAGNDYDVDFSGFYRELNLGGEGAPAYDQAVGKIDNFWLHLNDAYLVEIDGDRCIIEGELHVRAKHHDPETLEPWWDPPYPWIWGHAVITIDPDGISIEWGGALSLSGETRNIRSRQSRGLEFKANGRIESYEDWVTSSEIISGNWRITVRNGVAKFRGMYRELNNDPAVELSPAGTVDIFKQYMDSTDYWYEGDTLVVVGVMHRDKRMWFLDDYTPYEPLPGWFDPEWIPEHGNVAWIIDFIPADCELRISPDEMKWDNWFNGDWVYGSTLRYRNYT